MKEKSKDVTTFVTSRDLMRFHVMPFERVNSAHTNRWHPPITEW